MKRRDFLKGFVSIPMLSATGGVFETFLHPSWAQGASGLSSKKHKLVFIFQRGACDSLSMIHPLKDPYFTKSLRPNIFIDPLNSIKLNEDFGMHPAMSSLKPFWDRGQFNFIHQAGLPFTTRSHFDAQDFLENGTIDSKSIEEGFFTRALQQVPLDSKVPLKAISIQPNLPRSLFGEPHSLSVKSLDSFQIRSLNFQGQTGSGFESFFESAMKQSLNGQGSEEIQSDKGNTLSLLDAIKKVRETKVNDSFFPKGLLGDSLKDISKLIKSDFPAPIYVTEMGGWDTHVNQGNENGQLARKLKQFSDSISGFLNDLGTKIENVTVISVTEFGRTVKENGNGGTDHGHGCCYLLFGGQLKPKNSLTKWKELKKENLYEERDLPVVMDARSIFAEILSTQLHITQLQEVFPKFKFDQKLQIFI